MRSARLQLRIDARLKKQAEQVAKRQRTTLSALVMQHLAYIVENDRLVRAPKIPPSTCDGVEQI